MLVLARQLHERIVIPLIDTAIEVVAIRPGSVRLGIEAPPEVKVLRDELCAGRGAEGDSTSLTGGAGLRRRLQRVLLALARLQRQTHTLPSLDVAVSLEEVIDEVAI